MNLSEVRHHAAERSTFWLINLLCRTGVTPNTLTLIGLAVSGAAAAVIAKEYWVWGGVLVLLSGAFDLLDGPLARAKGQTTKFGALLDSVCDRLGEAAVLLGLLIVYINKDVTWEPLLIYTAFVGSVLVSYLKARAEGLGIECEVGLFTRAERVIALALGLILTQWIDKAMLVILCILTGLTFVTVLQRLIHVRRANQSI
ncbi:MAG: hypothetical protein A2Y91_02470 [Chloroflexi bacterium RBG_13_54_8]|nr:MAG: hypothetical protein A2Y91_02470 [Chloroflexi bacterium RBG_13_54_8]